MSTIEFNNNFDQLSSVLKAFAYNLTKDVEDAKDLFQETAFKAIKNKDKFRAGTNLKAWLFTIMRNIFINNYRSKVRANTIMDPTENLHYLNSGKISIANSGESTVLGDELTELVSSLDNSIKIPFLLNFQGYKYHEIAEHLGIPLGTVKSRIFFARKALRTSIVNRYGGRPKGI